MLAGHNPVGHILPVGRTLLAGTEAVVESMIHPVAVLGTPLRHLNNIHHLVEVEKDVCTARA